MAITINSIQIPTPSELSISFQDVVENERRDNKAILHFTQVRKNIRKLEFKWNVLLPNQMQTLLNALATGPWLTLTYPYDPLTKTSHTITCYAGDRKMNWYSFNPKYQFYTDITVKKKKK